MPHHNPISFPQHHFTRSTHFGLPTTPPTLMRWYTSVRINCTRHKQTDFLHSPSKQAFTYFKILSKHYHYFDKISTFITLFVCTTCLIFENKALLQAYYWLILIKWSYHNCWADSILHERTELLYLNFHENKINYVWDIKRHNNGCGVFSIKGKTFQF